MRRNSSVYPQRLKGSAEDDIQTLADVPRLPFTSAEDLRENASGFLCVSHSDISRIVSLMTSGTAGQGKRVYFTAQEQEAAIDFFQHALAVFAGSDDRILIALPGERPGSAGDLLATAVRRIGATPIPFGNGFLKGKRYLIHDRDPMYTAEFLRALGATGIKSVILPPRSPNLNAHAERFVRTIKESRLDRMIVFGEGSLRKAIREFMAHYMR